VTARTARSATTARRAAVIGATLVAALGATTLGTAAQQAPSLTPTPTAHHRPPSPVASPVPQPSQSTASPPAAPGAAARIKHVVVIVQEGRTFDNYFGEYPGAEGIHTGLEIPLDNRATSSAMLTPHLLDSPRTSPLDSGTAAAREAWDNGRMDGFVAAQYGRGLSGDTALGHYDRRTVDDYWQLAENYVLFDQLFSAALGGSADNHLFLVAGRTLPPAQLSRPEGFELPTVFDRLEAAGASWRAYVGHYQPDLTYHAGPSTQLVRVPMLGMPSFADKPQRMQAHLADSSRLYDDLAANRLPEVSYVYPGGDSERAPGAVDVGEARVTAMVHAIMRSSAWPSTAVFVVWSDWGGWYDHVPPPRLDGAGDGFRVPGLVISPFARHGVVDHTVADLTSILAFIERLHHLAPLTTRDEHADPLLSAFDFSHGPQPPRPVTVAGIADASSTGARRAVLNGLYGAVALVVAGIALAVLSPVLRRTRWRRGR
jgi:phospholipase C